MSRKREGQADWELVHQTHKSIVAMSEKASTTDTNLQGMLGFFSSLRTLLEALRLQLHYLSLLARGSPWVWGSTSKCTCAHMALDGYGCSHGPDLQSLCPALTPPATSRPADHGSSSTCSLDSSTTMDSPDFSSASVTTVPDKVDITVTLQMASLVDAYEAHSRCPLSKNPCLRPYAPNTALPRICINTSSTVGALAGRTNPSRSADSGTCRLEVPADAAVLAMFRSGHLPGPPWLVCQVVLITWLTPNTVDTCTRSHSVATPSEVPYSARDLPLAAHRPSAHLALPVVQGPILFPNSVLRCCC
jgi:hypothetical protein